ncbi:MAG TPA: hypothetical protein EYP90_10145, partial [Chromatiaceae bacterium]|nr:hypothetical protein [Chromatiaceae bacterium]
MRTPGKQCGLAATGDYQPSLRSPWLAAKEEKELKASTRTVEQRILFNQIIPAFGSLMLTELKWPMIRDWVKSHDWSRKTQNNKLNLLRRALNEAVEQELIHHHPMANKVIRRRKSRAHASASSKSKIDPFNQEERTALINTAHGQLKNLIQFGFWTGLRLSELFALNWGNIDWINKRVYVEGALTQDAEEIEATKTEAGERIVQLLPPAIAALKAQKEYTFLQGWDIPTGLSPPGCITDGFRKMRGMLVRK